MPHKEQQIWDESDGMYCICCESVVLCSYSDTGLMTHGHMTLLFVSGATVWKCVV